MIRVNEKNHTPRKIPTYCFFPQDRSFLQLFLYSILYDLEFTLGPLPYRLFTHTHVKVKQNEWYATYEYLRFQTCERSRHIVEPSAFISKIGAQTNKSLIVIVYEFDEFLFEGDEVFS